MNLTSSYDANNFHAIFLVAKRILNAIQYQSYIS